MLTLGLIREATTVASPVDFATLVSPLVPDVYASARMIAFVEGHDAVDRITIGRHERFVVDRDKFMARVRAKAAGAQA